MKNELQKLIKNSPDPKLISDVFEFAKKAYENKNRLSGENYIYHTTRVALTLAEAGLNPTTIAYALLHDAIDDIPDSVKKLQLQEIEKKFGKEIAGLVKKNSELAKIRYPLSANFSEKKSFTREKIENLRKMFLSIAGDLRVVLVELISRLDGLNFLQTLPEDKQKIFAFETLQIFSPIANRLGLNKIRRSLEDISFSFLFPEKFKWLNENIKEEYKDREKYLKHFIPKLQKILKKEGIRNLETNYRAKSYWSTYKKLIKKDMDFKKIHDLLALRIIVEDLPACYKTLGIVHKYFKPISDEINDYIAKPKLNGYRSLHTTVFSDKDRITEIQIRTKQMHSEAEHGICAHWSYKEKINLKKFNKDFEWVNTLKSQNSDLTDESLPEFWKSFKIDFFENQIFALTPKGDIIVLKKDSTPVDFAYAIHSEIGNHCESAKINGKIAGLPTKLENGDIVEIIINKKRTPSKDWLKFVKTSLAENHIKKFFNQKETFGFPIPSFIKNKIIEISQAAKIKKKQQEQIKKDKIRHIYLSGQKGMLINIAKCCKPEPGDKVKAYLTKQRSAVLHRTSCKNFIKLAEKFPERIVDASWE